MNLAFYGTLRDPDILRLAAGRDLRDCFQGTASVPGWACYFISGEAYPLLLAQDHATTLFSLYQNCPESAWEHLLAYEGDEYQWSVLNIDGQDYRVFLPLATVSTEGVPWDLVQFQDLHKAAYLGSLLT